MADETFEKLVEQYYEGLYRFAYSLCRNETEAFDLTQQTFLIWAKKGDQLRDGSKAKTWLFTSLYREFLNMKRRMNRVTLMENESMENEMTAVEPENVEKLDSGLILEAVALLEDTYRVPLTLFYLNQHSYKEISEMLDIPIGTVMSRLSRAKSQLKKILQDPDTLGGNSGNIISLNPFDPSSSPSTSAGHES